MKFKHSLFRILLISILTIGANTKALSQCFEIQSILVDACGVQEGLNEMVRFKVGGVAINTSNLTTAWPNNVWQGLVQNATTASKVAALNADILDAGGCGQLLEPTAGVLPANATVILCTSFNLDTALNSFGPLTDTIYIIFQNNATVTGGHFANSGTGLRTLTINFGSCTDTVTYNRALLIDTTGATTAADGATVLFDPAGNPTYINNGCSAPVQPFTADAGPATISGCAGSTVTLSGIAQGQQSVVWSATTGTFSSANALSTSFTIPANATGSLTLTLTATNSCGAIVSDQLIVTIGNSIVPNFATTLSLCTGATAPVLATTSPNGISGTWNPATISNTASGSYVFTPNANQCATSVTLSVTIGNSIVPNFATTLSLCTGATAPVLATTSPNGISGTWNPATISNTASGSYVFTPNANQCATSVTLNVTIGNNIVPNFATTLSLCTGATAPVLATVSPNGISGTWNPATINNTASGSYVFTPNANQCATSVTLSVTIGNSIVPNFATTLSLCTGATAPVLATTSPNGISGTWNPATINNTASGSYVFTPNANQCATSVTLNVTIGNSIVPNFATTLSLCTGATAPVLATTSPNGISGTWNPAIISNTASGSYVFTPNVNQCATSVTLSVTIGNSIVPNFATTLSLCTGATAPVLATTSPNGISGTWNPATISNTASGSYVFTPNVNQCATSVTLNVTIGNSIVPNFATTLSLCTGATAPVLATTSPNGISGTWNPATINNTASGSYVFTPNANQCATSVTLSVTIGNSIVPNFATTLTLCTGATAPVLATTSPNGISGTWNPATISNTASGSYVFTPNANQCATSVTLSVTIGNSIVPNFATTLSLCTGATAPVLATTSPNGISGTWNPATISNTASGSYVFTPNANQCATSVALDVTVTPLSFEVEQSCVNGQSQLAAVALTGDDSIYYFEWTNASGQIVGSEAVLNLSGFLDGSEQFPIIYSLTVTTATGCSIEIDTTVYNVLCNIPRGISPNGDGKNEQFDLSGLGVDELQIFSRYGTQVYKHQNYTNQWDGKSDKGDDLPDATYYYSARLTNGETRTGWVFINR